jgi:DNA-binding MarR family transcriptional regulator
MSDNRKKSFSDRLTPGQIQNVLDDLQLPWRDYYNPDNDGWVNIPGHSTHLFESDLSVNILHGGFVDQYLNGSFDEPLVDDFPVRGDIVTLVAYLNWETTDYNRAIQYIKEVCGMNKGVKPPDMPEGFQFANEWLRDDDVTFVRIPKDILKSKLTSTQKVVWAAIFSRCNDKIYSFPGIRRLADDTGLSKSTVQSAIKDLTNYGLLIEKYRGKNKAPARFPLVAKTEIINKTITDIGRSNSRNGIAEMSTSNREMNKSKQGVPRFSTGVSGIADRGVPKIGTELEPKKKNQYNKNQIAYKSKASFRPDSFSEMFLKLNKKYADEYSTKLLLNNSQYLIDKKTSVNDSQDSDLVFNNLADDYSEDTNGNDPNDDKQRRREKFNEFYNLYDGRGSKNKDKWAWMDIYQSEMNAIIEHVRKQKKNPQISFPFFAHTYLKDRSWKTSLENPAESTTII